MMIIGVPKEIKNNEYRVALLPVGVDMLKRDGHKVYLEKGAGLGSGITDGEYQASGAVILDSPAEIYAEAEMIVKIKEPQEGEYALLRPGQIVFTYFHFAAIPSLTEALVASPIITTFFETLQKESGELPCLT